MEPKDFRIVLMLILVDWYSFRGILTEGKQHMQEIYANMK